MALIAQTKPVLDREIPFPGDFQWDVERRVEDNLAADPTLLASVVTPAFFGTGDAAAEKMKFVTAGHFTAALAEALSKDGFCNSWVRQFITETSDLLTPQVLDREFQGDYDRLRRRPRYQMRLVLEEITYADE